MSEVSIQAANWRDYLEMTKPRVVLLMLLCALVGMFLAVPGMVPVESEQHPPVGKVASGWGPLFYLQLIYNLI